MSVATADQTMLLVDTAIAFEGMQETTRGYLGMSSLGHPCARKLWYGFRLCGVGQPDFPSRVRRLFHRGHLEEDRVVSYLRSAGIGIVPFDPEYPQVDEVQFEYVGSYGHAKGHSDGIVFNLPERPLEWGLVEMKTHNDRYFTALKNNGVKKAHPVHYCQCQRYMKAHRETYGLELEFALYIGVQKSTDEWHLEIIPYVEEDADYLVNREMSVVESDWPPDKLIDDPNFYTCRFCDFKPVCHEGMLPPKHCRTCQWSVVLDYGRWGCDHPEIKSGHLTLADQLKGCGAYLKSSYL